MKRFAVLLLCILLAFSLCACKTSSKPMQYARKSWNAIGSAGMEVDEIYFMEYTSRTHLSDDVLETELYDQLPQRGYAILFDTTFPNKERYACFFNDRGELVLTFDYAENYRLYEKHYDNFSIYNIGSGEKAVEYLSNCNYISGMILFAHDGQDLSGTCEKNIWYRLSDKQVKSIVG